jgi:hypothetical protein
MKSITYKALYWLFEITFYLYIITCGIILTFEVSTAIKGDVPDHYTLNSINPELVTGYTPANIAVTPKTERLTNSKMEISELKLTFDSTSSSTKLFLFSMALLRMIYFFVILYLLRKFIHSLKTNDTFTLSNVKYLTTIGVMLLLIEPLYWLGKVLVRNWVENNFMLTFIEKPTSFKIGFALGSGDFLSNWIVVGLLVLVISEVFKQGLRIKEENDLTV